MATNRRANATMFGFDFQVNAAILLMLENVGNLKTLRLEGENEDIEIKLNNGNQILAQAKGIEKGSSDFRNVRGNLKKSLKTLSEAAERTKPEKMIVITNSFNPFNEETSHAIFAGPPTHRKYADLPLPAQQIVDKYLSDISEIPTPLDKDKLVIQTIPFETDEDEERYKWIMQAVNDFMGKLSINVPGMGRQLLALWQNDLSKNGTRKNSSIELSKKDLIWPMLVIVTDIEQTDEEFIDCINPDVYEEVVYYYKDLIDSCCERYEFFIRILCDYNNFRGSSTPSQRCIEFVNQKWNDYVEEFNIPGIDEETQEVLTKIVLYNVVKRRLKINKIKKGVNL